jgi:hypothetical protein
MAGGGELMQQRVERGRDGAGPIAEVQPGLAVVSGRSAVVSRRMRLSGWAYSSIRPTAARGLMGMSVLVAKRRAVAM